MANTTPRPALIQILAFFTPAALLVIIVFSIFMRMETQMYQRSLNLREKNLVALEAGLLENRIRNRLADISILADLIAEGIKYNNELEAILTIFMANTDVYDQVRLLSPQGMELVRINAGPEGPVVTAHDSLQNKSGRTYFRNAVVAHGSVAISAFDLNIEHGKIEVPFKPMIRFSKAVYDSTGKLRGVVVLNYLGQILLDQLRRASLDTPGVLSLLNASGYWLYGPDPSLEWAFMFDKGETSTFSAQYPEVWKHIQTASEGQIKTSTGLFSFHRVCVTKCTEKQTVSDSPLLSEAKWYIVSHVPTNALSLEWYSTAIIALSACLIALFVVSWVLAKGRAVRRQSQLDLKASETMLRLVNTTARDAMLMTNSRGEILYMNPAAFHLFEINEDQTEKQRVHDIISPADPDEAEAVYADLRGENLTEDHGLRREVVVSLPSGSQRVLELSIGVQTEDTQRRIVATFRDMTNSKKLQDEVTRRGDILEAAMKNMDQGLLMANESGQVVAFNPRFTQLFQLSSLSLEAYPQVRDLIEKWLENVAIPSKEREQLQQLDWSKPFVVEIPGPGGRELEMRHAPMKNGGFVQTFTDITERKEADDALRESNAQYMSLVSQLTSVVYRRADDIGWTMEFISAGVETLTGYPASAFTTSSKRRFIDIIHIQDRLTVEDAIHEAVSLRRPYLIEYRIIRENGEVRWVVEKGQATYDNEDKLQFLSGVITDMTDRIKADQELRRSWSLLQDAIDSIDAGLIMFDATMRVVVLNRKYKDLYPEADDILKPGVPYENILRVLYRKGRYEQTEEAEEQFIAFRLAAMKDISGYERQLPSGIWVSVSRHPTREGGVVALHHDISELKAIQQDIKSAKEAAESANQAKSEFLARMSHEIRTPMNAIIGMARLALRTQLTPKQYDYIAKIKTSGNALLTIINDILDFSKIEAGKMTIERVPFELDDVLINLSNIISLSAADKGLEIVFDVDPQIPTSLVGDPLRLGQILINLASNAVKFTHQGEIVVSVSMKQKDEDSVLLRFAVRDTGIGLSDDQQSRLFQSFSQADESTTRKYGGSGLGLAICKRLVDLMGGTIGVESQFGQGSTFFFTAAFSRTTQQQQMPEVPRDLRSLHILVVEENVTTQEVLQKYLTSFGFLVTSVDSVSQMHEALSLATEQQHPVDIVFMAWGVDGFDDVDISAPTDLPGKQDHPAYIGLASAKDREHMLEYIEKHNAHHLITLTKPVSQSDLFDAIMEVFGRSERRSIRGLAGLAQKEVDVTSIRDSKLLLVEDNPINQQVALEILHNAGFDVDIADNGRRAIEAIQNNTYEAVLMDVQMPELDGFDATRAIRREEGKEQLPIIAMTAHAMAEDRNKCLEAGMNDYVTKPIDPDELFSALLRWIPARTPQHAIIPEKPAVSSSMPVLDGIDVNDAMRRLSGNADLFQRLLVDFVSQFHDAPSKLQEMLDTQDTASLARFAHTLKGVAGNIGAKHLQDAATNLEVAVKEHGTSIEREILSTFNSALDVVLASTASFTPPPKTHDMDITRVHLSQDEIDRAVECTQKLITSLEQGNIESEDLLEQVKTLLNNNYTDLVETMEQHVSEYDTEGALPSARLLLTELKNVASEQK
ncbi:PAS-domain containing protein [Desulfovibrio inopinatus]|uniref:PAS-domain containing protein n=1 Tax=Desulfovibrio inopinatus TaxID=102109 RepID=UPI0003FD3D20|nr:PAS-domain containing protein [Desulfovibrio inopinatus]